MSDKNRSKAGDGGRGGGGGAVDDDGERPDPKEEKCNGCERKGKSKSLFRLRKRKQRQKGVSVNSGRLGGGGGWSCLCLKQPRTLDSSGESPTSDPNSSEFTFDRLRALIENNDFYSKECNPHFYLKENS